jgi:hypothetical protein
MAPHALALIPLLAIPFLLYCLWNFARELKPHKKRAFVSSSWPSRGSVEAIASPRLRRPDASTAVTRRPGRDFTRPARVS